MESFYLKIIQTLFQIVFRRTSPFYIHYALDWSYISTIDYYTED